MKATSRLTPSASSPAAVAGPSASTVAALHLVAHLDDGLLVDAGVLVGAAGTSAGCTRPGPRLGEVLEVGGAAARRLHDDALGGDARPRRRRAWPPPPRRRRARCAPPCPCRPAAPRCAAAAPPGAACCSPSARGWRRRARGTGSGRGRRSRAASATRPCSRPRPAWPSGTRPWSRESTSGLTKRPLLVERRVGLGDDDVVLLVGGQVDDLVADAAVRSPCGRASRGSRSG